MNNDKELDYLKVKIKPSTTPDLVVSKEVYVNKTVLETVEV